MDMIERVKRICLTPQAEWPVIAEETTPTGTLITGYVLPLAAIGAVAGFIGGSLVGQSILLVGTYRTPLGMGLGLAVFSLCAAVIGVFIMSFIINALAPTFSAAQNSSQALKVAVYSFTPAWVAGAFQILPLLGVLGLIGGLYGLYLLYLGLPILMRCPADKAISYTAVVVVCAIIVSFVLTGISATIAGFGRAGAGAFSGGLGGSSRASGSSSVEVDPDSPLGRLQQLGQGLEESARRAEAAGKEGDQAGQAAAAFEGLGALLGGGKKVDPLAVDQLKPFIPETFAGLARLRSDVQRTGAGLVRVSTAEATYGDGGDREVDLEITDSGGMAGLMGLASWMNVQQERESDDGYERTQRVDGRMTHMKSSKSARNEFAVVIGERFMVNATSRHLDVDALRAAVAQLDLAKLESMKTVGVSQ